MHSFSIISANVAINHILLKLDSLSYIFVGNNMIDFSIGIGVKKIMYVKH